MSCDGGDVGLFCGAADCQRATGSYGYADIYTATYLYADTQSDDHASQNDYAYKFAPGAGDSYIYAGPDGHSRAWGGDKHAGVEAYAKAASAYQGASAASDEPASADGAAASDEYARPQHTVCGEDCHGFPQLRFDGCFRLCQGYEQE